MAILNVDLADGAEIKRYEGLGDFKRGQSKRRQRDVVYNTTTVIALDPGGVTGWSLMCVEPYALSDPTQKVLRNVTMHHHGELESHDTAEGYNEVADHLLTLAKSWPSAAIVIEDFVIRSNIRSREFLSPVRITEKVDWALWKAKRSWFRQTPADAKTTATDARLREWGMYDSVGSLGHARDADRHAITFLRRAKQKESLRAEAWPHLYSEGGLYVDDASA